MTLRQSLKRHRLAALLACSSIVTMAPYSARAEYGIPAGSGAITTAGQPMLVRVSPGWDAGVSYEIADGSYVTVYDVAQTAPDGSLWYPVDGGFLPVDAVTSVGAAEGSFSYFQEAAPESATQGWVDPNTGQWVEPASVAAPSEGWVDPNSGQWVESMGTEGWVDPNTGQWVEPAPATAPSEGWIDTATGQWVEPTASGGWVDPATGQWVEPSTTEGWDDPATGQWVESTGAAGWVDPNSGQWVDPATTAQAPVQGWIDPNTGQWVEPAPVEAAPAEGWVDPNTGQWVEPAAVELAQPAVAEGWTDPPPMAVENTGGIEPWGEPIATAYIAGTNGDGVACRAAPEQGTSKIAVLAEGEAVEVRGEAMGEWQPVNCSGVGGYVNTSFVSWEPTFVELEQKRRDRDRDNNGNGGKNGNSGGGAGNDGTATSSGQQIASFAQQYVGYPYAYAGEGPYAFDCSGFTKFVIQNTLGMDITHDMFAQYDMGQQVSRDALQPGDLVFFANTFRPGMSHNGIYVGGGQFVHAENESTGVKVSDLNSDYYSSRWYGAVRFS